MSFISIKGRGYVTISLLVIASELYNIEVLRFI